MKQTGFSLLNETFLLHNLLLNNAINKMKRKIIYLFVLCKKFFNFEARVCKHSGTS